ncbi:MAG: putative glycoside hydrolase [Candidatus Poribacteria bacterium]|nr:putative glycoside hydrolase [Candidatus Poribacteria bacterium]
MPHRRVLPTILMMSMQQRLQCFGVSVRGLMKSGMIFVNSNRTKIPRSASYVNGMYMETINSPSHGYTHQNLIEIEKHSSGASNIFKYFFSLIVLFVVISPVLGEFSVREKLDNRSMPSIFIPWGGVFVDRPELTDAQMIAYHDLFWSPEFELYFEIIDGKVELLGDFQEASRQQDELLRINPNMVFILQINMRGADPYSWHLKGLYTEGFPWITTGDGSQVLDSPPEHYVDFLIDFTHPKAQEIIIGQVIAVAESGLWNGVFFDFWNEKGIVLEGYRTYEAEQQARTDILQGIRETVSDDFLIIVNNTGKLKRATPYVNGIFMETFREDLKNYTHDGLKYLENILLWAEDNLREPQIICLEAEGIGAELPTSLNNRRELRKMTTLSLTHSEGYMTYTLGVQWGEPHPHIENYWEIHSESHDTLLHIHHHESYWNDFWSADLGQPIGERGQLYEGIDGLFIREFTNGWVVYNRSGKAQDIQLPMQGTGVESGITSITHTLPDLDGEIYLKQETEPSTDVNGDGVVNIQDLVIVANALGKAEPDLNGDGVVNIQDLVIVADNF